jgi:hypothetical protein
MVEKLKKAEVEVVTDVSVSACDISGAVVGSSGSYSGTGVPPSPAIVTGNVSSLNGIIL